jgi:nucleoside-diphosphate-sugar epimerase
MGRRVLVTGGSGYFGGVLVDRSLARGDDVRILDLNRPQQTSGDVEVVVGDVRDLGTVESASRGVDVVFHTVAQVPLARDRQLLHSVNVVGTASVLLAARRTGVAKIVHTSSSAVYGIPARNPVDEGSPARPLEPYGRAKLEAEAVCRDAAAGGVDVTIVRPRTILGSGRLGIMAVLFDLVSAGAPVYVLDGGGNRQQFVHAEDLAEACLLAGDRTGVSQYNVGATEFGTMRETLEGLVEHANTGSSVRSLPGGPARFAMRALASVGQSPFVPYHWLLYGESLWFDTTKARDELGWSPRHSNLAMVIEAYDWFLAHRDRLGSEGRSPHQTPARLGLLKLLRHLP